MIALISLAYLEEGGLLLSTALLAAVIVLTVAVAVVWETVPAGIGSAASGSSSRGTGGII